MIKIAFHRYCHLLIVFLFSALCALAISSVSNSDLPNANNRILTIVELMALVYLIAFVRKDKYYDILLISYLLIVCVVEEVIGLGQFFSDGINGMKGNFPNSGPYASFLAVCLCVLNAYSANIENRIIRYLIKGIVVVGVLLILTTKSRLALIVVLISFISFCIRNCWVSIGKKQYGIVLLIMIPVLLALYLAKKPSADGRLFMKKMGVSLIINGETNKGLFSYPGEIGKQQADYFSNQINRYGQDDLDWTVLNKNERMISDCPDMAFDDYLRFAVEMGLGSMLLFVCIIALSIVLSYRNNSPWFYGMLSLGVIAAFSYPSYILQFRILFCVILAACINCNNEESPKKYMNISCYIIVSILLFFMYFSNIWLKEKESPLSKAERLYYAGYYDSFCESCEVLFPDYSSNTRFLFEYGRSLNQIKQFERSDSILSVGLKYSSDPMFWIVKGNNSMAIGDYREAETRYKYAFYMVPNRLYPLVQLAKLYHIEGDTIGFLDMVDRIDRFVPKIESLNTEGLREEVREIKEGYIISDRYSNE